MPRPQPSGQKVDRQLLRQRDAALDRVRRITKAAAFATVAALGAFAGYVSSAIPGRSSPPAGASTTNNSPQTTSVPGNPSPTPSPSNSLAPPVSAPAPVPVARTPSPVQSTTS
jgi:hypothetical protein